jgi:curved DNA-binding protein CbpA
MASNGEGRDPAMQMNPREQLNPELLRLFLHRIERSLRELPIDLLVEVHRERVAELLRRVGQATYYELLGVAAAASPVEIHEGYERVARSVHPMLAPRLGLEGREAVLELLFEQVTEAYLLLSKEERRKVYDRELEPQAWSATSGRKTRPEEIRDRARSYFSQAITLAAAEDYHFAIELLREAVRWDPRAEYYALLGQVQAKNDRWLHHAAESYRQAIALGGSNPPIEAALRKLEARLSGGRTAEAPGRSSASRPPHREEHRRWYIP